MFDVFMFMLSVVSLSQMINPLPQQPGFTGSLPRILACHVIAATEVRAHYTAYWKSQSTGKDLEEGIHVIFLYRFAYELTAIVTAMTLT